MFSLVGFHPTVFIYGVYMGVSKNRGGPPQWMVKIMENPIKMDDLGVPLFWVYICVSVYGCFRKWWVSPQSPPQVLIIFSRKTPWLLGKPTIVGNPHMVHI